MKEFYRTFGTGNFKEKIKYVMWSNFEYFVMVENYYLIQFEIGIQGMIGVTFSPNHSNVPVSDLVQPSYYN